MSILDRYIATHILSACLLVFGIIFGLDILLSISAEGNQFSQDVGVWSIILSVLYEKPLRAYQMMPMVLLLGSILGLGRLTNSGELTAMRASGMSLKRLALAVMKATMPLLLCGVLLGEYVVPWAQQVAKQDKMEQGRSANTLAEGFWLKNDDTFVWAKGVTLDNQLRDLYLYEYEGLQWRGTLYAKSAQFTDGQWQLSDGYQKRFIGERIDTTQFSKQVWPIDLSVDLVTKLSLEPSYLSVTDLWDYINYLSSEGINADTYTLAFWEKIFQPLFSLSLIMVGMSFVFGSSRSVPIGQHIFFGALAGLGFSYAQNILGPISSLFGFSPVMAYATPVIMCGLSGWYLLRRVR